MRVSLGRWGMVSLVCLVAAGQLGCRSGGAASTPGFLSWNKKQDPAAAIAATRPSTQLPPSPAQTVGAGSALTASGAPGAYPVTGVGSAGYAGPGAATDAQKAGYFTGPYGTNGPATGPYQAANAAPPGARPAANPIYGAAPGVMGNGEAAPYNQATYTADRRTGGNNYTPMAAPGATGFTPYNGGNGLPPNQPSAGSPPANFPPNGGTPAYGNANAARLGEADHGHAHNHAHSHEAAPAGGTAPYSTREGGYRPGSTARSRPFDGAAPQDTDTARPGAYDGAGSSYGNQNSPAGPASGGGYGGSEGAYDGAAGGAADGEYGGGAFQPE